MGIMKMVLLVLKTFEIFLQTSELAVGDAEELGKKRRQMDNKRVRSLRINDPHHLCAFLFLFLQHYLFEVSGLWIFVRSTSPVELLKLIQQLP